MKKKVALLAGGFTGERVISLQTADTIAAHLDKEKFEAYKILIEPEGWYYSNELGTRFPVNKDDFSISWESGSSGSEADASGARANSSGSGRITFDIALIAVHGSPGEDGLLQAYLTLLKIPFVGCDTLTSAITMNKAYTKGVLSGSSGLFMAASVQLFRHDPGSWEKACEKLKLPLFVKPNNGGSSIGMSKVNHRNDLKAALDKAFREDTQVLVEEYIKGREFSIGVYRAGGKLQLLPCTEIVTEREFFDFDAKYSPGASEEITPGHLPDKERKQLEYLAGRVYEQLNCRGAVRIDFIREEESGRWFFIEVNTVPGQSENSILPRQVRASGQTMAAFYTLLLEECLKESDATAS